LLYEERCKEWQKLKGKQKPSQVKSKSKEATEMQKKSRVHEPRHHRSTPTAGPCGWSMVCTGGTADVHPTRSAEMLSMEGSEHKTSDEDGPGISTAAKEAAGRGVHEVRLCKNGRRAALSTGMKPVQKDEEGEIKTKKKYRRK
jgi:hypothetical protein